MARGVSFCVKKMNAVCMAYAWYVLKPKTTPVGLAGLLCVYIAVRRLLSETLDKHCDGLIKRREEKEVS